jgi:LacI family transcriptional regulator
MLDSLLPRGYHGGVPQNVSGAPFAFLGMVEVMVTIRDVAREAGVSVTTVSRALNGHDDVAAPTRARIREVATRLEYHPNVAARSLQASRAGAIGLIIPSVLHRPGDPFWGDFIVGVATACAVRDVDLLVSAADSANEGRGDLQQLLRGRRVDGLIVCDVRRADRRVALLRDCDLPFVAFGRTIEHDDYPHIDVDGAFGTSQAVQHLISLGHRHIAYLGVDSDFSFSYYRLLGYRQTLRQAGISYDSRLVIEDLTEASARDAAHDVLCQSPRPTAVFAAADFLAIAVLSTARALGLAVPAQLSIAVFDDSQVVRHAQPPLTAIAQPNRRVGEEAAHLLVDRITNPGSPPLRRSIVPTLVVRESTGRAPLQIDSEGVAM